MGVDMTDLNAADDIPVRELHLVKGRPVIFKLRSQDVLHSAYMPHFRNQMNCVPGMTTQMAFTPTMTTEEMRANIEKLNDRVKDPQSEAPQQPPYIEGILRSLKPEFAVLVGLCTHLGCVPSYRSEVAPADLGDEWLGGLFCPCHGSRYDMAGRVFDAQPAPLNLEVPAYRYDDDVTLTIGLYPEAA